MISVRELLVFKTLAVKFLPLSEFASTSLLSAVTIHCIFVRAMD